MKKLFYYIWHTFNRQKCEENSFWFYGKRFCNKCKRGIEYLDYNDNKTKKC
jgi:hypothetical protein